MFLTPALSLFSGAQSPAVFGSGFDAVFVSGAGSAVNGVYTERGTLTGKPYYNRVGSPDNTNELSIYWGSDSWYIVELDDAAYQSNYEDTAFPWLTTFNVSNGEVPAPTLTPINNSEYNAVIVSGAGAATSNGTYEVSGSYEGRNQYVSGINHIRWNGGSWGLFDDNIGDTTYIASDDTAFPWEATGWFDNGDYAPVPTFTPTKV